MNQKRLLLASGLALLLASFTQAPVVPLYDGVGFPDEPYRYVNPPPDLPPTQRPVEASGASTVQAGLNNQLLFPSTSEQAPQVSLYLPRHSLITSATAHSITLHVRPIAPDSQPTNATIAGNIYSLHADSDSGAVAPNGPASIGTIALRLPQNIPGSAAIYYRATQKNTWQPLKTTRIGNDIYQADLIGLGDYALTIPSKSPSTPKTQNSLFLLNALVAGIVVSIGITIFIVRRSNGH